jgi:hypothetical protein
MDRRFKGVCVFSLLVLLLNVSAHPSPSLAQADNTLSQFRRITLQGDVVSAGVGLRGEGSGEITIFGLPDSASVVKAYLYWATIGTSSAFNSVQFNNQTVSGTLIGISGNTCWSGPPGAVLRNFVFRAEVTTFVPGDGTYSLAGLPNNLNTGNDSQGASLVVIYHVPGFPHRTIIMNDGAVTLDTEKNTYTDTIEGFEPSVPEAFASITYIIGDGQSEWRSGDVTFNGEVIASNVFNGADGEHWGTLTFDATQLSPTSPSTTTINNEASVGATPDCLLWVASVFSITSPAPADIVENLLSPFYIRSHQANLAAAGTGLRGSGRGEIRLSDLPSAGSILQAYLYWGTIGTTGTYHDPTLNGERLDGELIGVSGNTCWASSHPALQFYNFVYRADVTHLINGPGPYQISGLPNALADGNDSQGASLVVIYAASYWESYKTFLINNGAVTLDLLTNSYTDTLTGFETSDPLHYASVTYIMGDGQSRWDTGDVTFNGETIASNVFNGVDGAYWGTLRFDVSALNPNAPSTTTIDNQFSDNGAGPDCLLWAATIFSVSSPQPFREPPIFLPLMAVEATFP